MHTTEFDLTTIHYTRWVFRQKLPAYMSGSYMPFVIVSVYERTGPAFTKHVFVHLN
jgi:hypothetical protein